MDFFPVDGKASEKTMKIVFTFFFDRKLLGSISGRTAPAAISVQTQTGGA